LARAASAVGKGENLIRDASSGAYCRNVYSADSEHDWLLGARTDEAEKNWFGIEVRSSPGEVEHAADQNLWFGSVYPIILDAAAEPVELGVEKNWLEMARAACRLGNAERAASLYFKDSGVYFLDAVSYEPTTLGLGDDWAVSQPDTQYSAILVAIQKSRGITALHDDWDGEGAQGYDVQTWERATQFLLNQATFAHDNRYSIGVPRIAPADHGSIDIHWTSEGRELLVNIPADPNELGTYFGQKRSGDTISGVVNIGAPRGDLVVWLTQQNQKSGL